MRLGEEPIVIASWLLVAGTVLAAGSDAPLQRYRDVRPGMGSTFEIVLYADSEDAAKRALDAAFDRIDQLNRIFSDYDSDSEALRLCRQAPMAEPVPVSAEMAKVLQTALEVSRQSEGAFDVTVGPMTRLWRRARRQRELPSPERLDEARAAVGFRHVSLDAEHQRVKLAQAGIRLDFGGIAKGYACDEALRVLGELGVDRAFVNAGGGLAVAGPPPGEPGWRIGVAPLKPEDPPTRVLQLTDCGVATSGDAWQFVEIDGQRYSHLVDPRTGLGITRRSSVTVLAADGMLADALASAASVLGPVEGVALVDRTPAAACLMVCLEGDQIKTYASKRFPPADDISSERPSVP